MNAHRNRRRPLLLLLTLATALTLMGLGGAAAAAGPSLSLEVKGQYAKRHYTACGKPRRFRVMHRRSVIEFRGYLVPPTGRHFSVRLELKRCVRGKWLSAGDRFAVGKDLTGKYKAFFSARPLAPRSHKRRAIVFYEARAIVTGARSPHAYFAVTN